MPPAPTTGPTSLFAPKRWQQIFRPMGPSADSARRKSSSRSNATWTRSQKSSASPPSPPSDPTLIPQPDPSHVPNSGPTVASRPAMVVGKLVERAAQSLLATLAPFLSSRSEAEGSAVSSYAAPNYSPEDFQQAALRYLAQHGTLKAEARSESPDTLFCTSETS